MTKNYVLDAEPFAVGTEFSDIKLLITRAVEAESSIPLEDKLPVIEWIGAYVSLELLEITKDKILEQMPPELAVYADVVLKIIESLPL